MKQHRTLRRGLGILLALTMGLCLLAATALAETQQTADFTIGDGSEALSRLIHNNKGKAEWNNSTKTLTLKGVNFSTSADIAVKLPAGSTIVLAEGTKNTITSTFKSAYEFSFSCSIFVGDGNLTIEGGGQLAVKGGTANQSNGIVVYSGSLTIDSGTVTATGGEAYGGSYGIYTDDGVTINGGIVTVTGSKSRDGSHSIVTNKDVTINGGTVTATGGKAKTSYGISALSGKMTISGGRVTARTLAGAGERKAALGAAPDLSAYTGCYWRIGPDDYYNDTTYPYSQAHTYVEFAPEGSSRRTPPI